MYIKKIHGRENAKASFSLCVFYFLLLSVAFACVLLPEYIYTGLSILFGDEVKS